MTSCSTPRRKYCRTNVKGSSVANTEQLKQASKRKHGMASNSSNGYDGYIWRGKEWLKGLVEGSKLESTLENPRGCPDSLEGVKWTMADLAHAFDIKPNQASHGHWQVLLAGSALKIIWGSQRQMVPMLHSRNIGIIQTVKVFIEGHGVGNPATVSDVMDTIHAASKKHGEEGIRTHSGAMSLSYMERIFKWNFETVKLKWKHLTFGCVTEDEFRIPHWKLSLVERKNWQSKLNNEVDLQGQIYEIYPQPELPSVDMDQHMRNWLSFLESHVYGRILQSEDFLFPSVGSNGIVQPGSAMSHDVVQKWIKEFCTGAGIDVTLTHLSTHCFRRGGSQYRFMLAPVGKRWTLATIRWWGGWAEGEHLHYYEEGHGDALQPIQSEVNMSFLGEHKDIRPVSLLEMKELWSSMERSMGKTIKAGFSHSTSDAAASHRHGEHTGIQSNNNTTNTTNVMPIPLPLSSLLAPPPPGLCIPAAQIGIPRHERWLTFVHDWENIDESRGLHKPLKD
ncbi:hypothetical protein BU17DRAFT_63476 [Hysterangium stoloniferum]|nr:hypothetical protein BU17DRAFT_63476 [Hysterangium stoloniferum]